MMLLECLYNFDLLREGNQYTELDESYLNI